MELGTSSPATIRAFPSISNWEPTVMCLSRCSVVWQDYSSSGETDHDEPQVEDSNAKFARTLWGGIPRVALKALWRSDSNGLLRRASRNASSSNRRAATPSRDFCATTTM